MRGRTPKQGSMLCLINPEERVPADHPLRTIKEMADEALKGLSRTFDRMYSKRGRPSVPPEQLLKSMLLMALYTVRSERQFCEQLRYNLLFQWFLDMNMDEEPFDHCAFSDNRERMMQHEVAGKFFQQVVEQGRAANLFSSDHFSVDGTLIEAWASMKSYRSKDEDKDDNDGNSWSGFKGEQRSNATHESKTDPEAKLMRKGNGKEAKLSFAGHALMENRNGLLVDFRISEATGRCEREVALQMVTEQRKKTRRVTSLGADAGYNTKEFVAALRGMGITPHVAGKLRTAIDARTTRHASYAASQKVRKRIEQIMGWFKTAGGMRKTRYRGTARNQLMATMVGAAYNLLRIAKLTTA